MKKFLIIIFAIFIFSNFFVFANINIATATTAKKHFTNSLDKTAGETGHRTITITGKLGGTMPEIIGNVIKIFLTFLGVIFLGLMIYGGYIWMMARGNEQEVEKAKSIIRNALIGLIVVLAAYAVTYWLTLAIRHKTIIPI